ncbi:kinase-like domain-containing protein [Dactylonectria estremocensis]|uniref:Kinase-like domain-containing protein n=1 Tax=Dactylonectria estremocensis TaxID=1079267 RepID=A0A9P9DV45_9HYPO|nr:kinase-like domain-containing protein [Dactylonectria estremocensis]
MSAAPSPNPASGSGHHLPLRSALKSEEDGDRPPPSSGSLKAVQIADTEPEIQLLEDESQPMRQFPAGPKRRLSGKLPPSQLPNSSSRSSLSESSSSIRHPEEPANPPQHHSHRRQYYSEKLLAQVNDWLEHEKRKASARKPKARRRKSKSPPKENGQDNERVARQDQDQDQPKKSRARSESVDSQSSDISFDRLQRILEDSMAHMGFNSVPHFSPKLFRPRHRKSNSRGSLRAASSDTDYVDGDAIVPSCDAWLDNSKTMSYGGGAAGSEEPTSASEAKTDKEREAWLSFKNEIIRIAHTLRLKGWRRIPLGGGDGISVERLSGALTNAVYVVSPPANMSELDGKAPPPKILLRIYGPQVEHLIDRENELQVLQRLARKRIGPRLLGTFQNGRFEQFFNAITLTPLDLRDQYISKQIAKRMRELHDGIELLPHERQNGPNVWRNWDQWLENVDRITTFLDSELEKETQPTNHESVLHSWKNNGYVCGAPWPQFKEAVLKYRAYLEGRYNGRKDINNRLVFAHSDTQYGNILRVRPDDEKSPLLQPANQHKQLIVIDFEYAGPNLPGIEFANHFTEWTYNYHDATAPFACSERRYPTVEEQKRCIKAYVDHRPRFPANNASTPMLSPSDGSLSSGASTPLVQAHPGPSSNSIVDFMLDARVPPGGWTAAERANEEQSDQRVRELLEETRLWRPANHIQWVAWGIVQAKVPGLDPAVVEEDIGPDEFDYLRYTQDRAMFFWGDCVQIGLVKREELPKALQAQLKIVDH